MKITEPDFHNTVWADEGGVMVSIHRTAGHYGGSVTIEIYQDVQDKERKPIVTTLTGYRWERLMEWLDKERPAKHD